MAGAAQRLPIPTASPPEGTPLEDLGNGLANWLIRLEAKLDLVLDLTNQSPTLPRREVRSSKVSAGSPSASPKLGQKGLTRYWERPPDTPSWKRELLRRGNSIVSFHSAQRLPASTSNLEELLQPGSHLASPEKVPETSELGLPGITGRRLEAIPSVTSPDAAVAESGDSNESNWRTAAQKTIEDKIGRRRSSKKTGAPTCGRLGILVASPQFDTLVTVVILLNACLIGAQVQHNATSDTKAEWFEYAEYTCTVMFTLELVARVLTHRLDFVLNSHERLWNLFDAFLVLVSLLDIILSSFADSGLPESSSFLSKLSRVIRVVRIMRIIRTVRFLAQLRVMMKMIVNSFRSLFWILVILVGIIYSFAVVLTAGATDYLKVADEIPSDQTSVEFYFGSLSNTMYTLFMCITGGLNWGEAAVSMRGPGWALEAVVVVYIFFAIFAVANIVNGVFVEGAIELAKHDRLTIVAKQAAEDAANEKHLINLLLAIDKDGDSKISFQDFCASLEREDVRDYIAALQLEITDAHGFFDLLDEDASGSVSITEFITGMSKLRGDARSVDVHMMLHETRCLIKMVCGLVDYLHEKIG